MTNAVLVMRRNTAWVYTFVVIWLLFSNLNISWGILSFHLNLSTIFFFCFVHNSTNFSRSFVTFSLFSKESGRTRLTQKVIVESNLISCLAGCCANLHSWFVSSDKTIPLLSGWHISLILSADHTSRRSRSGARIMSRRTAFVRSLNGEVYIWWLSMSHVIKLSIFFFAFKGIATGTRGGITCEGRSTPFAY